MPPTMVFSGFPSTVLSSMTNGLAAVMFICGMLPFAAEFILKILYLIVSGREALAALPMAAFWQEWNSQYWIMLGAPLLIKYKAAAVNPSWFSK